MFGIARRYTYSVVPFIDPEDVPHQLERFYGLKGNYIFETTENDVKDLLECISIADDKGLPEQSKLLRRRAIAGALECNGMGLIRSIKRYIDGDYNMERLHHDGKIYYVTQKNQQNIYSVTSIKKFTEHIPSSIIRDIPKTLIDDVKVLHTGKDPVIFAPITGERDGKWWGVAIYQW